MKMKFFNEICLISNCLPRTLMFQCSHFYPFIYFCLLVRFLMFIFIFFTYFHLLVRLLMLWKKVSLIKQIILWHFKNYKKWLTRSITSFTRFYKFSKKIHFENSFIIFSSFPMCFIIFFDTSTFYFPRLQ